MSFLSLQISASRLDGLRARLLRITLAPEWSQSIFKNRARRLGVLFCLALGFSFLTSLVFPLWVLAIGPVVYGIPHLFASFRYVGERVAPNRLTRAIQIFTAIFISIAGWRLAIDLRIFPGLNVSRLPHLPELISLLLTVATGVWLTRGTQRAGRAWAVILPVFYFSWRAPLSFVGFFLLAHNLVAFIYWILFARAGAERWVAIGASLSFLSVNALLFAGLFDPLLMNLDLQFSLPFAGIDLVPLGQMIFPGTTDATLWVHAVIAYAFGQSMHYFVWMKAIPDENHSHPVPTTFKQSLQLARRDFGARYVVGMVLFVAAGVFFWMLVALPIARTIYFALSAYHGYLEIAGLALGGNPHRA